MKSLATVYAVYASTSRFACTRGPAKQLRSTVQIAQKPRTTSLIQNPVQIITRVRNEIGIEFWEMLT